MMAPLIFPASATASRVFPDAVGPRITIGGGITGGLCPEGLRLLIGIRTPELRPFCIVPAAEGDTINKGHAPHSIRYRGIIKRLRRRHPSFDPVRECLGKIAVDIGEGLQPPFRMSRR